MNPKQQEKTVYLVDDDIVVLRLLQTLTASIGVESMTFQSADAFLSAYHPRPGECLVCDIRMPQLDGMALQKILNARQATIPVIFLTGFAEVCLAVEAMKLGAFDFLEKPFSAQSLLSKIESALACSAERHAKALEAQSSNARLALITPRERMVVSHVVAGKSSREIATLLGISIRTVENHRTRIMEKLHVESTIDLIKLFL